MATPTPTRGLLVVGLATVLFLGGCADDPPEVPQGPDGQPDPVLALGRDVFGSRCSGCHGSSGGGGTGAKLAGRVVDEYPDPADQVEIVRNGRDGMPSFGGTLTEAEIEAVVRYTREVLE